MPSEPIYLRWENTTLPHNKFYELEIELSLFYPKRITRRWGRIGAHQPHALHRWVDGPVELEHQVALIDRRRHAHGYQRVNALYSPIAEGLAA
jgi:predicted DNA-binding WGR domain protein